MTKNLKLSFVLYMIFYSVIIAWATLTSFFRGVGINFIALVVVMALLLTIKLTDEFVSKRTKEIFWASVAFAGLEFIIYLVFEFTIARGNAITVFWVFQRIFTALALIAFGYVIFRFVTELKDVKIGFVEAMLGNGKPRKKKKSNKELSNGSLEDKPNKTVIEQNDSDFHSNSNYSNVQTNEAKPETVVQESKDEE